MEDTPSPLPNGADNGPPVVAPQPAGDTTSSGATDAPNPTPDAANPTPDAPTGTGVSGDAAHLATTTPDAAGQLLLQDGQLVLLQPGKSLEEALGLGPPPPPAMPGSASLDVAEVAPPKIVKRVKEKRARHKKGSEKAAPGKLSWVWGTKLVFFSKRKDQWLVEAEAGKAGVFYTKMMKLYVKKYGYQLADDEDLEVDIEDPPDSAADEVVHERLPPEETDFRVKYSKALRGRIGQWYRLQYGSLLKSDSTAFTEMFTGVLDGAPPKPTRPQIGHYYSRKFYDSRVKTRADARIASLKRRAVHEGLPEPKVIDIISKVTKEVWEEETPEFRKECELALEREYTESMKAWEQTLDNAAFYLQPFVDAIQQRFGMCATVLLCGPVGKRGGRVMVQSVHAGKTKGLAPQKWPEHDWLGFQEVERIMCNFGKECFSDAECRARIVKSSNEDTGVVSSSASGAAGPSRSTAQPPAPGALSVAGTEQGSRGALLGMGGAAAAAEGDDEPVGPAARSSQDRALSEDEDAAGEKEAAGDSADGERGTGPEGGGDDGVQGSASGKDVEDEYGPGVDAETRAAIEACWLRTDRGEWTQELQKVHAAFERGKVLGIEWGECVDKFFDFERAWDFDEGTFQMGKVKRPVEFGMWLQRGRKWYLPPAILVVGTRDDEESFAGRWWNWYISLQPAERVLLGTTLSRPEKADWSNMAAMHGTNGLLQVIAALSWWGEKLLKRWDGPEWPDWIAAVEDMTWVLEELVDSGEIEAAKEGGKKKKRGRVEAGDNGEGTKRGGKRQKRKKSAEGEAGAASDGDGDEGEQEDEGETGKKRKKKMHVLLSIYYGYGSMEGLVRATERVLEDGNVHILCVADSQAALLGITSTTPCSGQYRVIQYSEMLHEALVAVPHLSIVNLWTPAHIGTEGNEWADQAAKNATESDLSRNLFVSLATVRRKIHLQVLNEWNVRWKQSTTSENHAGKLTTPHQRLCPARSTSPALSPARCRHPLPSYEPTCPRSMPTG
ncbi:hypothetical protein C8F04DRAFT_1265389 [Mycena alexandri]|uniref:RNase H type-1 domain-containing protein n=1 Tax=Mycena alexandri TaxID=1745969 RepID=A0AAD6SK52_9AGAR|nr:hypothetical protein C8F04DRAFT_1265389 [Mycena alexandri]